MLYKGSSECLGVRYDEYNRQRDKLDGLPETHDEYPNLLQSCVQAILNICEAVSHDPGWFAKSSVRRALWGEGIALICCVDECLRLKEHISPLWVDTLREAQAQLEDILLDFDT